MSCARLSSITLASEWFYLSHFYIGIIENRLDYLLQSRRLSRRPKDQTPVLSRGRACELEGRLGMSIIGWISILKRLTKDCCHPPRGVLYVLSSISTLPMVDQPTIN